MIVEIVAEPYISADPCHLGIYSYFYLLQILSKIDKIAYWIKIFQLYFKRLKHHLLGMVEACSITACFLTQE